jgi:hypothetical protein
VEHGVGVDDNAGVVDGGSHSGNEFVEGESGKSAITAEDYHGLVEHIG